MTINIVLLAGGHGTRLTPISNYNRPKQFLCLPSYNLSSFQLTLKRSLEISKVNYIIIATNQFYEQLVREQIREIGLFDSEFDIILEKRNTNTGEAVYDICHYLLSKKNDNITYFFPTDHLIEEESEFFLRSAKEVNKERITVFGQKVINICGNFGYMLKANDSNQVLSFFEKPKNKEEIYFNLSEDNIYCNLGVYLSMPSILVKEFDDLNEQVRGTNLPIDKMISEKSKLLDMISVDFEWSDIGSIDNLYQCFQGKEFHNCYVNNDDIIKFNEENAKFELIYNSDELILTLAKKEVQ